jgi:hypothetical protein
MNEWMDELLDSKSGSKFLETGVWETWMHAWIDE